VDPQHDVAEMPTERMGPPPGALPPMRMTASWLGPEVDPTEYKFVASKDAPMASSLGSSTDRHRRTPKLMQKAPVAVHHRSACSGVKALRNTSAAKRQAAKLWLAFRSLDPFRALREPDRRRRDEERPFRSEQRTGNKPKRPLDRKSPIQVCKLSVPLVCRGSRTSWCAPPKRPAGTAPPHFDKPLDRARVRLLDVVGQLLPQPLWPNLRT
jgi:hypothetical protein